MNNDRCRDCGNLLSTPHQIWCRWYREPPAERAARVHNPETLGGRVYMIIQDGPLPVLASIAWVQAQVRRKAANKGARP